MKEHMWTRCHLAADEPNFGQAAAARLNPGVAALCSKYVSSGVKTPGQVPPSDLSARFTPLASTPGGTRHTRRGVAFPTITYPNRSLVQRRSVSTMEAHV